MKRLTIVCLLFIFCISGIMAQEKNNIFLFEEFEKGVAYFRDGRQFDANVNYSLLLSKFVYFDSEDNILKLLTGDMVSFIKAGDRIFQITQKDEVKKSCNQNH